jgi:fibrillarin-like rRNA methylase
MGAQCSKPKEQTLPREISILVEQVNIIDGDAKQSAQILGRILRRNSFLLKKRLAEYLAKLREIDNSDPRAKIYISEHARTKKHLDSVRRAQAVLAYMA